MYNFPTKMWARCSKYIVLKKILEHITNYNSLRFNVSRTFYNDKRSSIHLEQHLRQWRSDRELQIMRDNEKPRPVSRMINFPVFYPTRPPEMHDFLQFHLKLWWQHKKKEFRKNYERLYYREHRKLGPDLTTAKFMIKKGGRVKINTHDEWIELKDLKNDFKLPTEYNLDFAVTALDLNGYPIEFSNLDHICDLNELTWLSLRGCETINDWAVDKIAAEYPILEHLDISECINVTERALEALYKIPNLKRVIITNFYNSAAMELTGFMLEDINPYLTCEIRKPEKQALIEE